MIYNNMVLSKLTFEQSKLACELGFTEITNWWLHRETKQPQHINNMQGIFYTHYAQPETALFLQWCRIVHGIHGQVFLNSFSDHKWTWQIKTLAPSWKIVAASMEDGTFNQYQEAESALIDEILASFEHLKFTKHDSI